MSFDTMGATNGVKNGVSFRGGLMEGLACTENSPLQSFRAAWKVAGYVQHVHVHIDTPDAPCTIWEQLME